MRTVWAGSSNEILNDNLAEWCARHIGLPRPFEKPYITMGVHDGDDLKAVILWNNYQPEAGVIEFHGAATSKKWLTRPVLKEMFSYPFEAIGCQMVVTRNSDRNTSLHRMLRSYGFYDVHIPRLRGRDEGEFIWTLTAEDWASNKFNKE